MKTAPSLAKQYVEHQERGSWIVGTRISLDSVVYAFLQDESPEHIATNFSQLSLEQVYGAIAFYLANQELIDEYLKEGEQEFEVLQHTLREKNLPLYQKLKLAQTKRQV